MRIGSCGRNIFQGDLIVDFTVRKFSDIIKKFLRNRYYGVYKTNYLSFFYFANTLIIDDTLDFTLNCFI